MFLFSSYISPLVLFVETRARRRSRFLLPIQFLFHLAETQVMEGSLRCFWRLIEFDEDEGT